jgi:DNA invertase Pin-like site-specific DNA recombinase
VIRAAIYARVSTEEQADRDKSIPEQLSTCRAYCLEHDWTISGEQSDPGISGTVWPRPGLASLLAAAQTFDRLVCWTFSRLARDEDLSGFLAWSFRQAGVEIVAVDQDRASDLERGVHRLIDAEHVRRVRRDVLRALTARASRGEFNGGSAPRGYVWRGPSALEIEPAGASTIRTIYDLYDPSGPALPVRSIVQRTGVCRSKVRKALAHPIYAGAYVWRGPDPVILWGHHEPIIGRVQWDRCQGRLQRAGEQFRNTSHGRATLALTGLLICGVCGKPLASKGRKDRQIDYLCRRYSGCPGVGRIRTSGMVRDLLARIYAALLEPGVAEAMHEALRAARREGDAIGTTRTEIRRLGRARDALLEIIRSGRVTDTARLADEYEGTDRQIREAQDRLRRESARSTVPTAAQLLARFAAAAERLRAGIELPDLDHAARPLLHSLVDRIVIPEIGDSADADLRWQEISSAGDQRPAPPRRVRVAPSVPIPIRRAS